MSEEHSAENDAPSPTVAEAIAAWEEKGPTSLTVALMSEALYGVREVCDRVEASPTGWGGAPVVSLVRTLRTRPIPPAECGHQYPPANSDGTCPSCGKTRVTPPGEGAPR